MLNPIIVCTVQMPYPLYPRLDDALLCFILLNGGSERRVVVRSVYEPLAIFFQLKDYEHMAPRRRGHRGREWDMRVRLARQRLAKKGLLVPHGSDNGYWTLTSEGAERARQVLENYEALKRHSL